jgi:hypothetical protein
MTWFVSSTNQTESAKAHVAPFIAVDLDFSSGHVRLWTGLGNLVIGGNTYTGAGYLARIKAAPEHSNLTVERRTYQLAGADVNPAVVPEADIDSSFGRSVIEYLGFLNADTGQLVDTPETNFEGEISNIRRSDGPEPVIEVNADHRMVILDQNDGWRWTHEHQQEFYPAAPTDNGLNQMAAIELREVLWGGKRVIAGTVNHPRHPTYRSG